MSPEKVKALTENVNALLKNYHDQQRCTAELFKICLEFLDESKWPRVSDADVQRAGGAWKVEAALRIKRKERKQQLIAAIKDYIQMIEKRDKEKQDERNAV